jgi:dienelactone hydrolase
MKNILMLALLFLIASVRCHPAGDGEKTVTGNPALESFVVRSHELNLKVRYENPERRLSFSNYNGDYLLWKEEAGRKFAELLSYTPPGMKNVRQLRNLRIENITYRALVMEVSPDLSIPAYLLEPDGEIKGAVMAIQGHGSVENVIGLSDDYHHMFAYELAKDGYLVIAPNLRGFTSLSDVAVQLPIDRLDYSVAHSHFTLVTHLNLHGESLLGKTIEDLIAWENWVCNQYHLDEIAVAGISYGGDLALYYPVFSDRVSKIFASGSLGSFNVIFSRCYNAPAHGIPGVLRWFDRSDLTGLNAPRPIMLHYGELDTPSETNNSASYNETVEPSVTELREIYSAAGAEDRVLFHVSPGRWHEMDVAVLKEFLNDNH